MARVLIVGPGAIGGTLAGNLMHAGRHEVMLGGRREAAGVDVVLPGMVKVTTGPVVTTPESITGALDWILVATKTYAAKKTARWLEALVGPTTRVAIFQNGVEHLERFEPWVPREQLVPVVIDCPAERLTPDTVVQRGDLKVVVSDNADGEALRQLFISANQHFRLTGDILTASWRKLTLNSIGVLNAMTLQPNRIMHTPAMAAAAEGIARECVRVAQAAGADLDESLAPEVVAEVQNQSPDGVNSLLADCLAARPNELDARNGAIVRFGQKFGVPTPLNALAVAVVEAQGQESAENRN